MLFTTPDEAIDETYGINVQFEESEDEDDADMYGEIRDDQDVDDEHVEEGVEADEHTTLKADVSSGSWCVVTAVCIRSG